ncbi:MAG: type II toxin-antitoxin system HicB family antitoxin [Armatimonadetes bacterium]|nr:type II toxin-antitoxin system HicB family antitoxin [Armatimonadota bacterium]
MKPLRIILEFAGKNWGAFSPQVDGVIATGQTHSECLDEYLSALRSHLGWIVEDGDPVPPIDLGRVIVFTAVYSRDLGRLRKSLGASQGTVAERLGLPQSRISELEREPGSVSFERMQRYLAVLADLGDMPVPPSVSLVEDDSAASA